jgi:hypothetical protein
MILHPLPMETVRLTPLQGVLALILLFLVLWVAYRIGIVILRIVAGLLFMGLAGYGIWYLFFK